MRLKFWFFPWAYDFYTEIVSLNITIKPFVNRKLHLCCWKFRNFRVPLFGFVLLSLVQDFYFRKINLIKVLKVQVTELNFSATHRWFILTFPSTEAERTVQTSFVVFLICSLIPISFVSIIHCCETWTRIGPVVHPGADMSSFLTGQSHSVLVAWLVFLFPGDIWRNTREELCCSDMEFFVYFNNW